MNGYLARLGDNYTAPAGYTEVCPHRAMLTQAVLNRMTVGLIGLDAGLQIVLCNHSVAEMLGVTALELWSRLPIEQLLANSGNLNGVAQLALGAVLGAAIAPADSDVSGSGKRLTKISLSDGRLLNVTVNKVAENQWIATLAIEAADLPTERIDGLTGLSDRLWFRERVAAMLEMPNRTDQIAVLMIDLDRFKAVNDSHGHPVGDALLQTVARRLRSAVRDGDVVSRLGGDEFAVAMPVGTAAEALGLRLVDLLSRPYLIDGHVAVIGASVGIALAWIIHQSSVRSVRW
jgi:diguanylate cyclase (GGDEF)-like protein